MVDALWMDEQTLPLLTLQARVCFRLVNLGQPVEVVGVSVSDQYTIDLLGFRIARTSKAVGKIAREQLVVPAIHGDDLPLGVSITDPSPCWTSTKSIFRIRLSFFATTISAGRIVFFFGVMNPETFAGFILPSSSSSKIVTATSTCEAVTFTTSTSSPQARMRDVAGRSVLGRNFHFCEIDIDQVLCSHGFLLFESFLALPVRQYSGLAARARPIYQPRCL